MKMPLSLLEALAIGLDVNLLERHRHPPNPTVDTKSVVEIVLEDREVDSSAIMEVNLNPTALDVSRMVDLRPTRKRKMYHVTYVARTTTPMNALSWRLPTPILANVEIKSVFIAASITLRVPRIVPTSKVSESAKLQTVAVPDENPSVW